MAANIEERRESAADLETLFGACRLGTRTAPNRLTAQPMEGGDGDPDGAVSEHTLARYEALARGGWGVVIVEAASVTPASVARARGLVLTPRTADSFRRLVARCKALCPEALLLLQITHSGPESRPETDRVTASLNPQPGARSLSTQEIETIRRQFVEAALLAEEIGFDGIDYKLCHAYLGAELLRPANVRTDRWGGSFENRTRFLAEGMDEIRARRRSSGFILGSRFNFYEHHAGGFGAAAADAEQADLSEPLALIRLMGRLGLDYVNLSGHDAAPQNAGHLLPEERDCGMLWYERLATDLVRAEQLDLCVVGSGYSALQGRAAAIAAARIRAGHAQLVGFGRQIFADPLYPARLRQGEAIAYCRRCGACATLMLNHRRAGCVVQDPYYRDLLRAWRRGA